MAIARRCRTRQGAENTTNIKKLVRTCSSSCMLSMALMLDCAVEATCDAREVHQRKEITEEHTKIVPHVLLPCQWQRPPRDIHPIGLRGAPTAPC